MATRSGWWVIVLAMIAATLSSACTGPSDNAPPRVLFAPRTALPAPPTPLPTLDTAAAITVFQQRDNAVKAAKACWLTQMTPTSGTLAEATRRAGRLAAAYREFADALRANQWPQIARSEVRSLAMAYDGEFVQYETLAEATSVGRYRAVEAWMHSEIGEEFESRAGLRHWLGLPVEPTGFDPRSLVVNPPSHSPPTAMAAC